MSTQTTYVNNPDGSVDETITTVVTVHIPAAQVADRATQMQANVAAQRDNAEAFLTAANASAAAISQAKPQS